MVNRYDGKKRYLFLVEQGLVQRCHTYSWRDNKDGVYSMWTCIGYKEFDTTKGRCPKCNSLKGVKPFVVFFAGQAPQYISIYRAFEVCKNSESILIVLGTMGNVVPVDSLIEGTSCNKILNNLEKSSYIDDKLYNTVYYKKATITMPKIEKLLVF